MNKPSEEEVAAATVAVVPCLNESATIAALVTAIHRSLRGASASTNAGKESAIVIDDGSSDGTADAAAAAGAKVLRHETTRGKGAAIRTGLEAARQLGYTWALLMDGDGQHATRDIPAFLACAATTRADLIVGNRMHQPKRMPWVRRQVNRWMSRRLSRLTGQTLPDSQCGFRLLHLPAWTRLNFASQHFEIESEMLVNFVRAGHRVEFVPIEVIYKSEQSKIHPWRDTLRWFAWWRRSKSIEDMED